MLDGAVKGNILLNSIFPSAIISFNMLQLHWGTSIASYDCFNQGQHVRNWKFSKYKSIYVEGSNC